MTPLALPLAHAGHWLAQLAYLLPLLVLGTIAVVAKVKDKRAEARGERVYEDPDEEWLDAE